MADILYIVVPCYNEEEVLPETSRRLRAKLDEIPHPRWQIATIRGVGYKFEVNHEG